MPSPTRFGPGCFGRGRSGRGRAGRLRRAGLDGLGDGRAAAHRLLHLFGENLLASGVDRGVVTTEERDRTVTAPAERAKTWGEIDKKLTEQINLILHHEDLQKLEGTWRGLHYLVNNTETDEMLKIRFMDISKVDLGKTLKRFKGTAWDQSPIFKKVYEAEYGQFGGEPFGCLVGDYYFDQTPPDVELLGEMAQVAAAAHTPFIAGASPTVMQMDSWQELPNPQDLQQIVSNPAYASWQSLRESEDARYIGLTMPRVLARLPYGAETVPVAASSASTSDSFGVHAVSPRYFRRS